MSLMLLEQIQCRQLLRDLQLLLLISKQSTTAHSCINNFDISRPTGQAFLVDISEIEGDEKPHFCNRLSSTRFNSGTTHISAVLTASRRHQ